MLAYCLNNPCLYSDPYGENGFVGLGFQFDVSTEHGTYGVEVVIYWDPDVVSSTHGCEAENAIIAIYTYSGVAISLDELAIAPQLYEMTASLNFEDMNDSSQDELLVAAMGLMTSLDLSGAVFLVYGYDSFISANSYSGEFQTWAASVSKPGSFISGGLYYSYSDTCWSVGAKVSGATRPHTFPLKIQFSRTYYSDPTIIMGW